MNRIALALTIAAISTSAAAQSTLEDPYKYFRDMTKTYEAKTNPAVPVAPSSLPTETAIEKASPDETEVLGRLKDLAGTLFAYDECKREFAGRGQQAVKDCTSTVMKRRDNGKIDSVDRRTRLD